MSLEDKILKLEGTVDKLEAEKDDLLENVKDLRDDNKLLLDKLEEIRGYVKDCYSTLGDIERLTK